MARLSLCYDYIYNLLSDEVINCCSLLIVINVMVWFPGHSPGPELEFAQNRECYSLAAGLALGMIALGVRKYNH